MPSAPSWSAESNQAGAGFGASVAPAGDVNGDGYSDVLVGAHRYDNGESDEGRVYLYLGSATGLAFLPAWTVESDQAGARLGASVALAGDVNGDGYSDVIVGTRRYDGGGDEGRACVYLGSALGLATSPAWTVEGNRTNAEFGYSVACAGDVNGDGYGDVLVSAWRYENGQAAEGRAYAYLGSAAGLAVDPVWVRDEIEVRTQYGGTVASAGDVNGDGYGDVLVGAEWFGTSPTQHGRAFLYLGSPLGPATEPAWLVDGAHQSANFGGSLGSAGDVNGDGCSDIIVGAVQFTNDMSVEGGAFVYLGNNGSGGRVRALQQRTRDDTRALALLDGTGDTGLFRLQAEFPGLAGATWASPAPPLAFLEWEVKPLGTPFDGEDLQRSRLGVSLAQPGVPARFDELALLGRVFPHLGDRRGDAFAWRARVLTNNPLFPRTAWFSQAGNALTEAKVREAAGRLR